MADMSLNWTNVASELGMIELEFRGVLEIDVDKIKLKGADKVAEQCFEEVVKDIEKGGVDLDYSLTDSSANPFSWSKGEHPLQVMARSAKAEYTRTLLNKMDITDTVRAAADKAYHSEERHI